MPRVMDVHVSPNILKFLLRLSNVTGWFGKRHIWPYVSSQMWTISIKSGRTLAICLALTKSLTTRTACGLVLSCRVMGFWCLRKNDKTCMPLDIKIPNNIVNARLRSPICLSWPTNGIRGSWTWLMKKRCGIVGNVFIMIW